MSLVYYPFIKTFIGETNLDHEPVIVYNYYLTENVSQFSSIVYHAVYLHQVVYCCLYRFLQPLSPRSSTHKTGGKGHA